ncbi:leucyl aminopeptidase [Piscinibacter koreensis]|uniref:Probable cytosol aminopeptidase n=1 Tax=Piscinibacter koreensis TaxID=2742824 RepID=A0A7Y6NS11_9BURK|nr:leucyl aminopeptidase [Schlegelella koreensis]NUZ08275.1 leucyl aminopeptidase [Schlegelella koreensis]
MDFRHQITQPAALAGLTLDTLVLIVRGDGVDPALPPALSTLLNDAIEQGDLQLKKGKSIYMHRPAGVKSPRVVFAVAGDTSAKAFKAAVAKGLSELASSGAVHVGIGWAGEGELGEAHAEALIAAAGDATYVYRETKPSAPPARPLKSITLLCTRGDAKAVQQGLRRGRAIAAGVALARELGNRPANHCTPTVLANEATRIGTEFELKVEVLDQKAIEKIGMGSFLAVARGSAEPPRFIVARYDGAPKGEAPIVLVGKGITFDSGGISIKPSGEMDEMKFDMSGAASVLGALRAIAELKPRLNLVCLVPTCENMPDARAMKPSDVVTSLSGQTIEVLNTDAEGRLILCDALTYAERFKPAAVVDVATLTGACVVALGSHHSGLFTPDEELAARLVDASRAALDPCWRMPLDDEYDDALKSNFADVANVGGRPAGAVTAAMFLRRFAGNFRWAHLDIAGTAWKGGAGKGSTGRPVGLLTHFVLSHAS